MDRMNGLVRCFLQESWVSVPYLPTAYFLSRLSLPFEHISALCYFQVNAFIIHSLFVCDLRWHGNPLESLDMNLPELRAAELLESRLRAT
jgi:hypothetical protein